MKNIVFGTYNKNLLLNKELQPKPLKEYIPNYLKDIKPYKAKDYEFIKGGYSNFKTCPSYIDIYKYGYVILSPTDIWIKVEKNGDLNWKIPISLDVNGNDIQYHYDEQLLNYIPNKSIKKIIKYNSIYYCFTPKGYSIRQIPVPLSFNTDWEAVEGVLRTDKEHQVNIQIAIKTNNEILIKQGTPLCVYVPFKRENIRVKMIDLNKNNKYNKKLQTQFLIKNGTFKPQHLKNNYFK